MNGSPTHQSVWCVSYVCQYGFSGICALIEQVDLSYHIQWPCPGTLSRPIRIIPVYQYWPKFCIDSKGIRNIEDDERQVKRVAE